MGKKILAPECPRFRTAVAAVRLFRYSCPGTGCPNPAARGRVLVPNWRRVVPDPTGEASCIPQAPIIQSTTVQSMFSFFHRFNLFIESQSYSLVRHRKQADLI